MIAASDELQAEWKTGPCSEEEILLDGPFMGDDLKLHRRFARLETADDDEMLAFAVQYGPLGLEKIGLPFHGIFQIVKLGDLTADAEAEPVSAWRHHIWRFDTAIKIHDILREFYADELLRLEELRALSMPRGLMMRDTEDPLWPYRQMLEWVVAGTLYYHSSPVLDIWTGAVRYEPTDLLGCLAALFAREITGSRLPETRACDGCGTLFEPRSIRCTYCKTADGKSKASCRKAFERQPDEVKATKLAARSQRLSSALAHRSPAR